MKYRPSLIFSLVLNLLLAIIAGFGVMKSNRIHTVEVQVRALGLIVEHRRTTSAFTNLVDIVEAEGERSNMEAMGLNFNHMGITNDFGDRFELVQKLVGNKQVVHISGETFSWP